MCELPAGRRFNERDVALSLEPATEVQARKPVAAGARSLSLALALAFVSACSVISPPTIHMPGRVIEQETGRGPLGVSPRPPTATPSHGTERRACRSSPRPSGWIAVAYVAAAGECPRGVGADSLANGAILMRYSGQPIGMELDVCADQGVPRGWSAGRAEADEGQRCPGAGRGSESAVRRIRRIR